MKQLSKEECDRRMRAAFQKRGIDYTEHCRAIEQKKAMVLLQKQRNIERNMYHKNHEDDLQFGCCAPDTLAPYSF